MDRAAKFKTEFFLKPTNLYFFELVSGWDCLLPIKYKINFTIPVRVGYIIFLDWLYIIAKSS